MFTNDSFSDSALYCPDFILTKKENGHTMRRIFQCNEMKETQLEIVRHSDDKKMIPITDIDKFLSENNISLGITKLTLGKANKFNDVKDALELYSSKVTRTYDSKMYFEKHTYTVPIIGYTKEYDRGNIDKKPKSKMETNECHKKERFIIIDNCKYLCDKKYKPHAGMYIPLIFPFFDDIKIPDDSQYFRVEKSSFNNNIFTYILPMPTMISGISLRSGIFKYKKIHSTTFKCINNCGKDNHNINVLSNNPGFIKCFELSFRSPETKGKWIELGKFNGSNSIFSHDLITFDETLIKEFRVTVLESEGNIEKIRIEPFGRMIFSNSIDESSFVTYTLYTPRDGHYVRRFEKHSNYSTGKYHKSKCYKKLHEKKHQSTLYSDIDNYF